MRSEAHGFAQRAGTIDLVTPDPIDGRTGDGSPGRRSRLSLDRVVAAAVHLARTEGLATVTMRRVASELGTAPMSLYRHVADRHQLLVGMLDDVALSIDLPDPHPDPRTELHGILEAVHRTLVREPWVVPLLLVDGLASPHVLPVVERMFAALERGGLTGREAHGAYALLWHFVYGETMTRHHDQPHTFARTMARREADDDPERFPALARLTAQVPDGVHDYFQENLDRILDSLRLASGDR